MLPIRLTASSSSSTVSSPSSPFSNLARIITCLLTFSSLTTSHTVITYPGWRGDNLKTTGDIAAENGLGVGANDTYPYGMQWIYPCGGKPISENRTLWPVTGGAIGLQPGWFRGHANAFMYINLGDGNVPENYSLIMQPVFEIIGPNNDFYDGSICIPQVPLPANYTAKVGNNATIQVVEAAQHGAALYNCVDITFAEPQDVPEVNKSNCDNTSNINFELVFSTTDLQSAATQGIVMVSTTALWTWSIAFAVAGVWWSGL